MMLGFSEFEELILVFPSGILLFLLFIVYCYICTGYKLASELERLCISSQLQFYWVYSVMQWICA